ncbi:hypothetical protein ACJJIF_16565 [Microbulbifer sp. SSSA002]
MYKRALLLVVLGLFIASCGQKSGPNACSDNNKRPSFPFPHAML